MSMPDPTYQAPVTYTPYPGGQPVSQGMQPVVPMQQVFQIGDILVSQGWVYTPLWQRPANECTWVVRNYTQVNKVMPQWALILGIILGLVTCLLGFLLLLIKEDQVTGYIEVAVSAPGFNPHSTIISAQSVSTAPWVYSQVAQVQALRTY